MGKCRYVNVVPKGLALKVVRGPGEDVLGSRTTNGS